jgi:hypothetical protein
MSTLQLNMAQTMVVVVEDLHIFRILEKVIPPIHPITKTTEVGGMVKASHHILNLTL